MKNLSELTYTELLKRRKKLARKLALVTLEINTRVAKSRGNRG